MMSQNLCESDGETSVQFEPPVLPDSYARVPTIVRVFLEGIHHQLCSSVMGVNGLSLTRKKPSSLILEGGS